MKIKIPNIRKNYKAVLGVMLLAFLLWFMVKMNKLYEYSIDVPIEFVNLDQDMIFKYPFAHNAHVEFLGKGMDLVRLRYFQVNYRIDLSGAPKILEFNPADHPEYVNFPRELDISVKSVLRPRSLVIELDKKMQKMLPVEVGYQVVEPAGMILVGVVANPDSVLVTGPSEMFSIINQIETENKVFEEPLKPFEEIFRLQESEEYFAEYNPAQVQVTFNLQRLAEKEVIDVPVTVVNKPENYQVIPLPSAANVYVKGGEKILAELGMQDFQILIDFNKVWRPGIQRVKADLKTDAQVVHIETRPPVFELIVQKQRSN
jgi:hypothetical protein